MDSLAKYVAGPLALASFALGIWNVNPWASVPLWMLAALWGALGFLTWRRERLTLRQRVLRLANQVRRCTPEWWELPDYTVPSTYGTEASMAKLVADIESHRRVRWIPHRTRSYTDRLHSRVRETIEEAGRSGAKSQHLERFLSGKPETKSDLEQLGRELMWITQSLP